MTLAGDINETGHLDDGIFPVYVSTLACSGLPDCLPDWVTGRLAGWLAGWLAAYLLGLLLVQLWPPSDDTGICHDEMESVNRLMADGRAAAGTVALPIFEL